MRASFPKPLCAHDISIIIPIYNDRDYLVTLLTQLSYFAYKEIIIVDGGSHDGPETVISSYAKTHFYTSKKGRGPQIDHGIKQAKGDIIWILHADSLPPLTAPQDIITFMRMSDISLGMFPLHFHPRGTWLDIFSRATYLDSFWTSFGDQGFFFRRSDYDKIQGIKEWPLLEDVTLRRQLKTLGKIKKTRTRLKTSSRRFQRFGSLQTQWHNGSILLLYLRGYNPEQLYQIYYNHHTLKPMKLYHMRPIRKAKKLTSQ